MDAYTLAQKTREERPHCGNCAYVRYDKLRHAYTCVQLNIRVQKYDYPQYGKCEWKPKYCREWLEHIENPEWAWKCKTVIDH